jgi:hypothetical protein
VGARAKEEVGGFWSLRILAFALSDETSGEVGKGVGFVLSGAMRLRLRVFVAMHMLLALRFILAMTLSVRDDATGTSGYR